MIHGNGGNVSNRKHYVPYLKRAFRGDVFLWEYPGFGKLYRLGKPSCEKILHQAESMLTHWKKRYKKIVLYCESIGCVVGSHLASASACERLILQSGPASLNHMLHHLTSDWLGNVTLITEFNTIENCRKINTRTKIDVLHSLNDEIVPYHQGVQVFVACNHVKSARFHQIRGTHNHPDLNHLFEQIHL